MRGVLRNQPAPSRRGKIRRERWAGRSSTSRSSGTTRTSCGASTPDGSIGDFDADNPLNYGVVQRESNVNAEGVGIGGGVGAAPEGYTGHVTFYVEVPDVGAALAQAESLGGSRMMGPDKVTDEVEIGLLTDPEGHLIGLMKATG